MKKVKVIVVGCGNMGSSHARAYDKLDEFEIVGIVDANPKAVEAFNASVGKQYPYFSDFDEALANLHLSRFPRASCSKGHGSRLPRFR